MIVFSDTRGENHRLSKLNRAKVQEIRRRRQAGETAAALAREFHLHADYVSRLCRKKAWSWLP